MKRYTIEIPAVRKIEVIAKSEDDAKKRIIENNLDYHCGNHQEFLHNVSARWVYEDGDFYNSKVVNIEDY